MTELAYDTEDCIDDFRLRVEGPPHDGQAGFGRRSRSAHVSVDRLITALYAEASSLVGIDAPKKEGKCEKKHLIMCAKC